MSSYSDKLRDPRWQKKRLEILNRDSFTCQGCQATTKTLNVHHSYYVSGRDPWEYPVESLVTVCEDCHGEGYGDSVLIAIETLLRSFGAHTPQHHDISGLLTDIAVQIDFSSDSRLPGRFSKADLESCALLYREILMRSQKQNIAALNFVDAISSFLAEQHGGELPPFCEFVWPATLSPQPPG